jgi:hypothetical protein
VSGGSCSWDSANDGGTLVLAGAVSHTNGSLGLGDKTVTGVTTLTVTDPSGDFNMGGSDITTSGDVTITTTGAGNLVSGTSTLRMASGNLSSDDALYHLNISGSVVQLSGISLNGSLTLSGTLTSNANDLTVVQSTLINIGGTYNASATNSAVFQQDWINLGTLVHNNGTITFSGGIGQNLNSGGTGAGKQFYNIVVNKTSGISVTLLSNDLLQEAGGTLTMTNGELNLGGQTWTLGAHLDINDANTPALTINGGTLTDAGNGFNITLTDGTIDETLSSGGSLTTAGNFSQAGGTIIFTGQTVDCSDFIQSGGSFTGGSSVFTVTGDVSVTGVGTHTPNTCTINMTGAGNNTIENTVGSFANLVLNKSVAADTVSLASANALTLTGYLTITVGTFDPVFAGTNYNLSVGGNIGVAAGNTLFGGTGTLSCGGDWTVDSAAVFDDELGTVIFNGSGAQIITTGGNDGDHDFEHFTVSNSGTLTLSAVATDILVINGNFALTSGSFTPGNQAVDFYGTSWNSAVSNGFNHDTGSGNTVTFYNSGTISVSGDNTFFNFEYRIAGGTIEFANGDQQTFTNDFTVVGLSGNLISLSSDSPGNQWFIDVQNTSNIQYVTITDSNAITDIYPESSCSDGGGNSATWHFTVNVIVSFAEDSDGNGRLDQIRVRVEGTAILSVPVSGVTIYIEDGYTVNYPLTSGSVNSEFFIPLVEKTATDTDATPNWRVDTNTSPFLYATNGGALVEYGVSAPLNTPLDNAAPVVNYTLASAEKDEIFIAFSEYVRTDGGVVIDAVDFDYPSGSVVSSLTRITDDGGFGTSEALLTLGSDVDVNDILNQVNLEINTALDDMDTPKTSGDYPLADSTSWPVSVSGPQLASGTTHRVSDLALGLTGDGIVQPVYATDESEIDTSNGGIGLIKDFTASEWLQDEDIDLTSHINSDYTATTTLPVVDLYFDVDISTTYRQNGDSDGFWLPSPYDIEDFYGIAAGANPDARSLSMGTSPSSQLRLHSFDSSDSELKSVAQVEFLYYFTASQLFAARIDDSSSSDWYRGIKPWSFSIHDVTTQVGGVTILNNVINPENGETTQLYYELNKAGMVTIQVFDISGAMVQILQRGKKEAGEYSTAWDGRNSGGRVVARGVYFIRLVGPDVDETRKVMVVK